MPALFEGIRARQGRDEDKPNPPPRPKYRRASRACRPCSLRKVRCDLVRGGEPCTNCRLDDVRCFVGESRRGGRGARRRQSPVESSPVAIATDDQTTVQNDRGREVVEEGLSCRQENASAQITVFSDNRRSLGPYPEQCSNAKTPLPSGSSFSPPLRHGCRQLKSNSPLTSLSIDLPLYIRPLRAAISPVDLDFLSMKGAFELLQDHLGEALLDTYLQFVHPYILVLDRANLLRVFDTRSVPSVDCDEDSKLSLLLYWAIIFAASSHIKMSILQEMGYDSRPAARRALFRKTKLLYDLHIEQDPITLLQAVLLMSYRFKETDNQRELWFIAGFSTPFLQSMDFARLIRISAPSAKRTKLLRKIWWSCFVRDTLIAEQLMSPSKTKTEESDIPLLTLDDFDLSRDSDEALRTSAIIYIDQTKLCIHINRVLEMHASVTALISSDPAFSYGSTEAAISDLLARKIRMYDTGFTEWVNDLSEEAKLDESAAGDSSLQLQQTLLHMTYLIGLSILHRPLVLPSKSEVALARHINISIRTLSKDRLHHIATQTTMLTKTILQQQFCEYMPPYSITLLTTAITVHLMDIQFGHSAAVERLRKEVSICVRLLEDLREIYAEAGRSLDILLPGLLKAGIPCVELTLLLPRREEEYGLEAQNVAVQPSPNESEVTTKVPASQAGAVGSRIEHNTAHGNWNSPDNKPTSTGNVLISPPIRLTSSSRSEILPGVMDWRSFSHLATATQAPLQSITDITTAGNEGAFGTGVPGLVDDGVMLDLFSGLFDSGAGTPTCFPPLFFTEGINA